MAKSTTNGAAAKKSTKKAPRKASRKRAAKKAPQAAQGGFGQLVEIPTGDVQLDPVAYPWCVGMKIPYYLECLNYWNEVCPKLEGWGIDPAKVGCNEWIGTWVAYGRGVNQNKCRKRMKANGFALPAPTPPPAPKAPTAPKAVKAPRARAKKKAPEAVAAEAS